MHRDSHFQKAQEPLPERHSESSASRWLVVAVGLCGALAGGSIVESIAALASSASISVSPGHLLAEPLVLAGALIGGVLASILARRDHSSGQRGEQMTATSLTPGAIVPSEPMFWQPVPPMLSPNTTLITTSTPSARSKHRVLRTRRRIQPSRSHFPQMRRAISRSSAIADTTHHP